MRVQVKLFAVLRDKAGIGEFDLELSEGATVAIVRDRIGARFPEIQKDLHRVAFAVNRTYAGGQTSLRDGDELAVIPPVSGG